MQSKAAVEALVALGQDTRLAAYRLLVRAGPKGMAAGAIAETLAVPPSTLSRHLAQLERSGLLKSWRVQRQVFYAVDWAGTNALLEFLTEDCCKADPEVWCDGPSCARGGTLAERSGDRA